MWDPRVSVIFNLNTSMVAAPSPVAGTPSSRGRGCVGAVRLRWRRAAALLVDGEQDSDAVKRGVAASP
jgi:hypothetical protein